jgi:hypothetical protein
VPALETLTAINLDTCTFGYFNIQWHVSYMLNKITETKKKKNVHEVHSLVRLFC